MMRNCDKFILGKSEGSTFHLEMLKHRHWVRRGNFQDKLREREMDQEIEGVCKGKIDFFKPSCPRWKRRNVELRVEMMGSVH